MATQAAVSDPSMPSETALTPYGAAGELAPTAAAAAAQFEIQSAIAIAKRFPRNEDQAFERLMKSAGRTSFADVAAYSFPRGGATVEGPSVNLAREAGRLWGNLRYGLEIVRDDEKSRQIRAFAWDLESNTKVTAEDEFAKLVQRKVRGTNRTEWIEPDERDLRELTNRRGAICLRNCLLQVLPDDLIEDALARCKETLRKGAQNDPDGARKKIILGFSELNVTPEMLEKRLGHPLAECSPAEIAELRTIYRSIADGNSRWSEYVTADAPPVADPIALIAGETGATREQAAAIHTAFEALGVAPAQRLVKLKAHKGRAGELLGMLQTLTGAPGAGGSPEAASNQEPEGQSQEPATSSPQPPTSNGQQTPPSTGTVSGPAGDSPVPTGTGPASDPAGAGTPRSSTAATSDPAAAASKSPASNRFSF